MLLNSCATYLPHGRILSRRLYSGSHLARIPLGRRRDKTVMDRSSRTSCKVIIVMHVSVENSSHQDSRSVRSGNGQTQELFLKMQPHFPGKMVGLLVGYEK